jgi:hypothetical protein
MPLPLKQESSVARQAALAQQECCGAMKGSGVRMNSSCDIGRLFVFLTQQLHHVVAALSPMRHEPSLRRLM